MTGGCEVRQGAFIKTGTLLGNQVWLDTNGNGIQDPGEEGVGGVCVNLYDASGNLIQKTSADSNGYYGFDVQSGEDYTIEFVKPDGMEFTQPNVGDDDHDSDVDPSIGKTKLIHVTGDDLSWDAGLIVSPNAATPTGTFASPARSFHRAGSFGSFALFIYLSFLFKQRTRLCLCIARSTGKDSNVLLCCP